MAWMTKRGSRLWLAVTIAAGTLALGCSSENRHERTVAEYGERLEQMKQASDRHDAEVSEAKTEQAVADAEQRNADGMAHVLAELDQLVGAMGSCGHDAEHGQNTSALRGDIEAMRAMFEQHHKAMRAAGDMDVAHAEENSHQTDVRPAFDAWFGHHHEMTAHAGGCPCGAMHGGMMGH